MFEFNVIVYADRDKYEIKTWLKMPEDATHEQINEAATKKFNELGVELKENEEFGYEYF